MSRGAFAGPNGVSAIIEQHDADSEFRSWPRPLWHDSRCGYCAKPVTLKDGLSIFSDRETSIGYPSGHGEFGLRAVLEHVECGPDAGYYIDFKRLLRDGLDGPRGWLTHISRKAWYTLGVGDSLQRAHALCLRLDKPDTPPAPRPLPSKPYIVTERPSRVSANPRSISTRTRTRILERDNFRCRRCGAGPSDAPLVIDHIIPVAKGGTADESNLQTLCRPCNAAKSDNDPHPHDLTLHRQADG